MNYTKIFKRRALNKSGAYPILFDQKAWDKLQRNLDRDIAKMRKLADVTS